MRLGTRFFLIAIGLVSFFTASGQAKRDTVRENVNYQWPNQPIRSNQKTEGSYHYIGFQANQLLRQLLGSAGGESNPFTFTYSFNSVKTGGGLSFGLGFKTRNVDDNDASIGLKRNTKSHNMAFRVGYELKKEIGRRWIAGYGFDLFSDGGKSVTTVSTNFSTESTTTTKTSGFGLGPRLSLLFNISEKIHLGTETTFVFHSVKTSSKIDFPINPTANETSQKENTLEVGVPSALFLVIRF
jgi:hypothetical protein